MNNEDKKIKNLPQKLNTLKINQMKFQKDEFLKLKIQQVCLTTE